MSLFLLYWEQPDAGSPTGEVRRDSHDRYPPKPSQPLHSDYGKVKLERDTPKPALIVSDGLAAEKFLLTGKTVAAREGAELRDAFTAYVGERIKAGFVPSFTFVWVKGSIYDTVDLSKAKPVETTVIDYSSAAELSSKTPKGTVFTVRQLKIQPSY